MNGKWISIVSLILAIFAIVMAVGMPLVMPAPEGEVGPEGPQGPAGPQGPQGLSGPGAIIVTGGESDIITIESVCTHYSQLDVTISVPSNGTIVVTAQIQILVNHTYGVEDSWRLVIGESPTDCATSHVRWRGSISSNSTTDADADRTGAPMRVFIVTAGTFTYYANGYMVTGQDSGDVFWYGSIVAVFYPSQ